MPSPEKNQQLFDLCGGHPALDFVNSLDNRFRPDGPVELLADYSDLLRFMEQAQLLSSQQTRLLAKATKQDAAARALQSARELREAAAVLGISVRTLQRRWQAALVALYDLLHGD